MSIAIVSMLLLVPLTVLGIILIAVVSGQATRRNEERPGGEGKDRSRPGERGPGRE